MSCHRVHRTVKPVLASLALLVLATAPACAQTGAPLQRDEILTVSSVALGEDRIVDVTLPRGYDDGSTRYPILVVLDGESQQPLAAGISAFLADLLEMPPVIVVGLRNTHRTRDLTPAPTGGWTPPLPPEEGGVGGADRFVRFLADELIPELEARYRTHPYRILVGHSLGGLFAAHAMARRPELFRAILTLDPALWWNDRRSVDDVRTTVAQHPELRLASVEYQGGFRDDWDAIRAASSAEVFGGRIVLETGESHGSMPVRGLREGLRALFPDHPPPVPRPGERPAKVLRAHYAVLSDRLGYSVAVSPRALDRTLGMSLDAGLIDDARELAEWASAHAPAEAVAAMDARIREAEERFDPADADTFVPLVVPDARPPLSALAPFLGVWQGRRETDGGVDLDLTLTIRQDGDSILVEGLQVGPRGSRFGGPMMVLDADGRGGIELGTPMRGGVGMEVAGLRLQGPDRLTGPVEIRGFRIPPGATRPNVVIDVRRVEGAGANPGGNRAEGVGGRDTTR